jgi:hypothetical protein
MRGNMGTRNWNDPMVRASGEDSKPEEWLPKKKESKVMELRTPRQILSDLNTERLVLINSILSKIATALEKEYTGDPVRVWIYEPLAGFVAVRDVLSQRLLEKGWGLVSSTNRSSQKDGDSIELIIRAED